MLKKIYSIYRGRYRGKLLIYLILCFSLVLYSAVNMVNIYSMYLMCSVGFVSKNHYVCM